MVVVETWQSRSGLARARPALVRTPTDVADVVEAVAVARERGLRVKMVGAGHSHTDVAVTDGVMMRPDRLAGVTSVDLEQMTVTVRAGTRLAELNAHLETLGLALNNPGASGRQTVAGAISTGAHGSGGHWASLSAQVAAVELVLADGTVCEATPDGDRALLEAARLGLGAVGVLTSVTFHVEPAFLLDATERPVHWSEIVGGLDELVAGHHHVDLQWLPDTDRGLARLHDRTVDDARPSGRTRSYVEDRLLGHAMSGMVGRVGRLAPGAVPGLNAVSARTLGPRSFVDVSHRVLVGERWVPSKEMEYAVPFEAGVAALIEARSALERGRWRTTFPVRIRATPADDLWLSPSTGRRSLCLAFRVSARARHQGLFGAVEEVLVDHGGRPHWGRLHTRTAAALAPAYPRFEDFLEVRRRTDPDGMFANAYLERVLGW